MAWVAPKTDWKSSDRFNISDYNRIRGNLEYLHDYVEKLYTFFSMEDLGVDKQSYADYFYAREFNGFEKALEQINSTAYTQDIGTKQTFSDNGVFIDWNELNRLESATLKIYNLLERQENALPRMAFRLGNGKGVMT
jgi:hypothetical protein